MYKEHVHLVFTFSIDDISSGSLHWQPLSSAAELASIRGVGQCATMIGPTVVMRATELHHKHVLARLLGDQVVGYGIGEYNLPWPPPRKRGGGGRRGGGTGEEGGEEVRGRRDGG